MIFCHCMETNVKSVVSQPACRMDMTQLEHHLYIKVTVLHGRNARECHTELVESVGNKAHSYQTPKKWVLERMQSNQ